MFFHNKYTATWCFSVCSHTKKCPLLWCILIFKNESIKVDNHQKLYYRDLCSVGKLNTRTWPINKSAYSLSCPETAASSSVYEEASQAILLEKKACKILHFNYVCLCPLEHTIGTRNQDPIRLRNFFQHFNICQSFLVWLTLNMTATRREWASLGVFLS